MLGQEPPTYLRSITAVRSPFFAKVQAMYSARFAAAQHKDVIHLRVPIVPAQRPTMTEHNGLPFAQVFIVDVDSKFSMRSGLQKACYG